ncbi:MAG: hypothetical protein PHE67_03770 [Campylobacterales bacterium]|nr:hypothetical protein [Campylobacterales bacterium]
MVINKRVIEKLIKDLESIKQENELNELAMEEIKTSAIEEEKLELQKIKARVKEKTERALKKFVDKQMSNQSKVSELEEKKVFMIGQLYMKKNKKELGEEEAALLDALLSM